LLLAAFTDVLIEPIAVDENISLRAGTVFPIYGLFFVIVNGIALLNVERARRRCRTRSTKRRMGYLEFALLTPAIGILPYSVLLGPGQEFTLPALALVNLANFIVVLMILFLAFPLSYFGSDVPERVVKTELLRFMLRGPATGLLALFIMTFTDPTSNTLGLPGHMFMPFATVAIILLWQWMIDLNLPWLERRLIYSDQEDDQTLKLQELSDKYLLRGDLIQVIGAALESICDYLRVNRAFVVTFEQNPEILQSVGQIPFTNEILELEKDEISSILDLSQNQSDVLSHHKWHDFWILPLSSKRINTVDDSMATPTIGFMGIEAESEAIELESTETQVLSQSIVRIEQALDDIFLQSEIYAALEGLLPQISITRGQIADIEYLPARTVQIRKTNLPDRDHVIEQVRAALRHYWGGPGLTRSRLIEFDIVHTHAEQTDNTEVNALRDVLKDAIEALRPEGERDMRSPEWTLYNILNLRFIEKKKARETARRLYLAEATLYRKQNIAIEAVADHILEAEQNAHTSS